MSQLQKLHKIKTRSLVHNMCSIHSMVYLVLLQCKMEPPEALGTVSVLDPLKSLEVLSTVTTQDQRFDIKNESLCGKNPTEIK